MTLGDGSHTVLTGGAVRLRWSQSTVIIALMKRPFHVFVRFWVEFERDQPVLAWLSAIALWAAMFLGIGIGSGNWARATAIIVASFIGLLLGRFFRWAFRSRAA